MNAYFERTCTKVTEERICDIKIPEQDENYKDCIWICWWQGLENAPDIVKKCVESIRIHAGNHKIVIITDENYKEFVAFPTWLEEKYKRGIITKTHLSDLLRISLLARYGGIWLDSTFSAREIFSRISICQFGRLSDQTIAMFLWHVVNLQTIRLDALRNIEKFLLFYENIFWIIGSIMII